MNEVTAGVVGGVTAGDGGVSVGAGGVIRRGSGGPYEDRFGYSRVVRVGSIAVTAGCTSVLDGRVQHPGDAGAQARTALRTALTALAEVGAAPEQVIMTRMYLADPADAESVGAAHGEFFGSIKPAATMVVSGLIDPQMLVEIELMAWVG